MHAATDTQTWAVTINYNITHHSQSLSSYGIDLAPSAEPATNTLTHDRVVSNNIDRTHGVYATLDLALAALYQSLQTPFDVWQHQLTGEYTIDTPSRATTRGQCGEVTKIARARKSGVEIL